MIINLPGMGVDPKAQGSGGNEEQNGSAKGSIHRGKGCVGGWSAYPNAFQRKINPQDKRSSGFDKY